MKLIHKHKVEVLLFALLALVYFLLRLPSLTLQPIFADEAIYIRWAQVMRAEPTLRFLPLSDGKTPLFMWAMMPLFKVFSDPLFAGRFLSVVAGFFTLLGVWYLGRRFFNSGVGLWAAFLVVFTPYLIFFDRMALVDSMLAAFGVWVLVLALTLIKYPRNDVAMVLGYLLGGGVLTKTPGMINFILVPLTVLALKWKELTKKRVVKILGLWAIAWVTGLVIYNALRLGPGFSSLSSRNGDYIFSIGELLAHPGDPFFPHLGDIAEWFPKLFTWPVLIIIFWGVVHIVWQRSKLGLVILLWALVPLFIELNLLRQFTARYLLYMVPPLLLVGALGIEDLMQRFKKYKGIIAAVIVVLVLPFSLYFDVNLLTDPVKAPLPNESKRGYFEDWTAGYGLKEIAQFLRNESASGKTVIVGTEGYFGTLPDGLQIYLDKDRGVVVVGGTVKEVFSKIQKPILDNPTYYISNRPVEDQIMLTRVKKIKEYVKPNTTEVRQHSIVLYEVEASPAGETPAFVR